MGPGLLDLPTEFGALNFDMRLDINAYANALLIRFIDAAHPPISERLRAAYGDDWLSEGVVRHVGAKYLDRAKATMEAPMRGVSIDRADDEYYGVEHLGAIITGNWSNAVDFKSLFGDRARTEACLGEIKEVRHNLAHRRGRHLLRRAEVARLAGNCERVLRVLKAPEADEFRAVEDSLANGASPWGESLGGAMPPPVEVVERFVGRPAELDQLSEWIVSDSPQLMVWGYGGAGKSSLAFEFAREVREGAPQNLTGVSWVSAKALEYVGGEVRSRPADFVDRQTLVGAVLNAIYEMPVGDEGLEEGDLLAQLHEDPILLIVDDLDTVITDEDLLEFLVHDVRATGSRVLYTSRRKAPSIRSIEIAGFSGSDLAEFVSVRAPQHDLPVDECLGWTKAIGSVTRGYPLFIDDLLRHARLVGLKEAVSDWTHRGGDAAREYALRRQVEALGPVPREVVTTVMAADRALTTLEVGSVTGLADDDVEHGLSELLEWRLIDHVGAVDGDRPGFSMNGNTRRLVQRTYGDTTTIAGIRAKIRALQDGSRPDARNKAVAIAISQARARVLRGDVDAAIGTLKDAMTGELARDSGLHGALAWTYSRRPQDHLEDARLEFQKAAEFGSSREDTFFHWAAMERDVAEGSVGKIPDQDLLDQWRRVTSAADLGSRVVGPSRGLCQLSGYGHTRAGKTLLRLNEFTQAQGEFGEAISVLRRGIEAPSSTVGEVSLGQIYRSLVYALEGSEDLEGVRQVLRDWERSGSDLWALEAERRRLDQV